MKCENVFMGKMCAIKTTSSSTRIELRVSPESYLLSKVKKDKKATLLFSGRYYSSYTYLCILCKIPAEIHSNTLKIPIKRTISP